MFFKMLSSTNISIRDLAAYCLDYSKLVSGNARLSRGPRVELEKDLVDIKDLLCNGIDSADDYGFEFELITQVKHDVSLPNDQKTEEQLEAEKRLERDRTILTALTDINNKIKTQEYTKKVILETGTISFTAKRINEGIFAKSTVSDAPENVKISLFHVPVSFIIQPQRDIVKVKVSISDPYLSFAIEPLNAFLKQAYYDEIFELVTKIDSEDGNLLPITPTTLNEVWAKIKTYLSLVQATNISADPDMSVCTIKLATKTNYFLAEDLKKLADMTDDEMEDTSLGAWSSDDDMNIEYDVHDDGRTEIFFPFAYDKYQLKVLGVIDNKASIIEGPPGTGKSQTIANILCHLAATGKKVLFVSQKDQAVRGVKDKLKGLDIPFLFGYIPDRTSRLYTEDDERDSAVNTLKSLQKSFDLRKVSDQKKPLRIIAERESSFSEGVDGERSLFDYYNQRRAIDYVKPYSKLNISREWWDEYKSNCDLINELTEATTAYKKENPQLVKNLTSILDGINVDYVSTIEFISKTIQDFDAIIPERSGSLKALFIRNKMNSALKRNGKTIIQEIYGQVERIVFSEDTKTSRLRALQALKDCLENLAATTKISDLKIAVDNKLRSASMTQEQADTLCRHIESKGVETVFDDIEEYSELDEEIDNIEYFSANELNEEIKELQKYYKTNVCNYIRNRILRRIDEVNSQKHQKAIINRIASALSKSKKAYKTFDKLKNGEDGLENFETMSDAVPIWMMSLEDVNRIIPMVANAFDYVILDEASQCNLAYSLPVMYRAKHTVFFGDSLQMRDTNTLFKSNQQLEAIAKKNKISEYFQIKATEDSVKSVMDIATLAGFKTTVLRYHYRSPKELIGFSNENFYEAVGRSLEVVNDNILTYKDTNRVLINHVISAPDEYEDSGVRNYAEANYIKQLISDIKADPKLKDKSIAVLTFFNDQAELLRQTIEDEDVKVSIIEGIQGDERDIVIYSFVIRDPSEKKRYVSLTGEGGSINKGAAEGRVNVAFSRARMQVHCVTSLSPELWPDGIWIKRYLEYVDKNGIPDSRFEASDQQFDSGFEEEVFDFLAKELDNRSYTMSTQVKSCGFRIDLVVGNKTTGRRLAIECDGPTHFENGDGQVYVKDDWERQMVLETAGWHFYRISYFDWMEDREKTQKDALMYLHEFLDDGSGSGHTPESVKELKGEASLPEAESKPIYKTTIISDSEKYNIPTLDRDGYDTSDKVSSQVTPPVHNNSRKASVTTPIRVQVPPRQPAFTVGDREVDQSEFEKYLSSRVGRTITIRYQSTKKNSAHRWRDIRMTGYDSTYIWSKHDEGYPIRYRRDRVVDFR